MNAPKQVFTPAAGTSHQHESAAAHVSGGARYVDDIGEIKGTLYAAPVMSSTAHGELKSIDAAAALAIPGVHGVFSSKDIPGGKYFATPKHDEPVFAHERVEHVGQVAAIVVADSMMKARYAARKVALHIDPLPACLTSQQAHAEQSYVLPSVHVKRGDAKAALARSQHTLHGQFEVGGQEHFYLEGQVAYVLPQEQNQWLIYSSTQHPGEVQHWVAHALGVDNHSVRVECRRMGGGFGGKETQAGHMAVWAAIAAHHLKRPVKLRLDRDDDFLITGKRHPFAYEYTVGFDGDGLITGLSLTMLVNCGFSADLSGPVADRAIFHTDNAYFLSDVEIASFRCKTNTQSHTAFRGFGGPQGMVAIETIIGEIARALKLDPLDVRMRNLYGTAQRNVTHYQMPVEDNILAPLITYLADSSRYRARRQAIAAWNAQSPVIKRGIALTPVKFGISFTATQFNQAGALVHVYLDGSVQINHGGTEMGQGLHTKVAQIVADELALPLAQVAVTASDTGKVPNASATAASAGTDLNGRAAQFAARQIRANLTAFIAAQDGCAASDVRFAAAQIITSTKMRSFTEAVREAYAARVQLWSDGFYRTPKIHYDRTTLTGRPFFYFAYGAACSEVAIDTLTGEHRVLKVDILHDVGRSINPAIDIGQIEGGFIQGMGWLTTEELVWNDAGKLTTHAPSTYKIPATGDVPRHFNVELWPEPNREDNVFGSKAVGEPPFMLAISVWEAIRDAVAAARADGKPVQMNAPATPESVYKGLNA
jgi:xanthine dehydrogenase large subunit